MTFNSHTFIIIHSQTQKLETPFYGIINSTAGKYYEISSTDSSISVANPDVQIKEGPGHPDPEISGGLFSKKIFKALRASVWSNNKEGRNAESRNFKIWHAES